MQLLHYALLQRQVNALLVVTNFEIGRRSRAGGLRQRDPEIRDSISDFSYRWKTRDGVADFGWVLSASSQLVQMRLPHGDQELGGLYGGLSTTLPA
jgi:hypothetical protein